MTKVSKTALLEVPAEVAYQVVVDVEKYPQFLPGCEAVEIIRRHDSGVDARVTVSGKGLRQSFVTTNRHDPGVISMALKEGPFRTLQGSWHFNAIGDLGCRVQVEIEYELGGMLGKLMVGVADSVAERVVLAFTRRMESAVAGCG